jgi:hydroxyacylglutathione hydrolase
VLRDADILAGDGVTLRDIGIPLDGRILETPGHTVDSISILMEDGSCFAGDAAANFFQFAGTKYCVIFVCNLEQYYQSWQKIIAAGALRIFPAHGRPFGVEKLKKNLGKNKAVS